MVAANRRGEPVAEVEVGTQLLPPRGEEAVLAQPCLDLTERPLGVVQLERFVATRHGTRISETCSLPWELPATAARVRGKTAGITLPSV